MRWISDPDHGAGMDARHTMYPTTMSVISKEGPHDVGRVEDTTYGVVVHGEVLVSGERSIEARLMDGHYFSLPGNIQLNLSKNTKVVTIRRVGFRGQSVVGCLEDRGRLTYIDGCSDSLLVYPPRMGDPCLNHLHFPGDVLQTQHTHPSIRMGIVMSGKGVSWRGKAGAKDDLRPFMTLAKEHGLDNAFSSYLAWRDNDNVPDPLNLVGKKGLFEGIDMLDKFQPGGIFMLEEGELHSFATMPGDHMEIIAYHPETDWGPTDTNHPMLNRTYIKE